MSPNLAGARPRRTAQGDTSVARTDSAVRLPTGRHATVRSPPAARARRSMVHQATTHRKTRRTETRALALAARRGCRREGCRRAGCRREALVEWRALAAWLVQQASSTAAEQVGEAKATAPSIRRWAGQVAGRLGAKLETTVQAESPRPAGRAPRAAEPEAAERRRPAPVRKSLATARASPPRSAAEAAVGARRCATTARAQGTPTVRVARPLPPPRARPGSAPTAFAATWPAPGSASHATPPQRKAPAPRRPRRARRARPTPATPCVGGLATEPPHIDKPAPIPAPNALPESARAQPRPTLGRAMALVTAGPRRRPAGHAARTPARIPRHARPAVPPARIPVEEPLANSSTRMPTVEAAPTTVRRPANTALAAPHASNAPGTAIVRATWRNARPARTRVFNASTTPLVRARRPCAIPAPTPASDAWGAATARRPPSRSVQAPPAFNARATAIVPAPIQGATTMRASSARRTPIVLAPSGLARLAIPRATPASAVKRARAISSPTRVSQLPYRVGRPMTTVVVPVPCRSRTGTVEATPTLAQPPAQFASVTTGSHSANSSSVSARQPARITSAIVSRSCLPPTPMPFYALSTPTRGAVVGETLSIRCNTSVVPPPPPGRALASPPSSMRQVAPAVSRSIASRTVHWPTLGLTRST